MDNHDTALVLTRVMTSGVVMSIEKSDRELPGLAKTLSRAFGRSHVSLHNSRTAGIHAAVTGRGLGHGDVLAGPALADSDERFVAWLGLAREEGPAVIEVADLDAGSVDAVRQRIAAAPGATVVLDLTPFGFGPAAAVLTDDEQVWARAERLKIFGSYDLRTMWTQEEADASLVPGVQFNYRLSPLVGACIRMALMRAVATPGAA